MRNIFGVFSVTSASGKDGEDIASRFLSRLGYVILARNITNPRGRRLGELDIIATDGECVVFVEVKTRTSTALPLRLSVQREKLRRLAKIGEWYMKRAGLSGKRYRFDLVGVLLLSGKEPEITHIRSIFL